MTCSQCGCEGLHACPGAPILPWTEEDKLRLEEVLTDVFRTETKMQTNTIDVGPEVLPEITSDQIWCCAEGCGVCQPAQEEFEYSVTTDLATGAVTQRQVGQVWVSSCCKSGLLLWDRVRDGFVDFKIKVPEVKR